MSLGPWGYSYFTAPQPPKPLPLLPQGLAVQSLPSPGLSLPI